jgi:hypothetical protein
MKDDAYVCVTPTSFPMTGEGCFVDKYWAGNVDDHAGGGAAACCYPGLKGLAAARHD